MEMSMGSMVKGFGVTGGLMAVWCSNCCGKKRELNVEGSIRNLQSRLQAERQLPFISIVVATAGNSPFRQTRKCITRRLSWPSGFGSAA